MNDRELLELAAKAAVLTGHYDENAEAFRVDASAAAGSYWWLPHEDDGDALRLAVELRMQLDISASGCIVYRCSGAEPVADCRFAETRDIHASTRRAIVRAAAEVGRGMK